MIFVQKFFIKFIKGNISSFLSKNDFKVEVARTYAFAFPKNFPDKEITYVYPQ